MKLNTSRRQLASFALCLVALTPSTQAQMPGMPGMGGMGGMGGGPPGGLPKCPNTGTLAPPPPTTMVGILVNERLDQLPAELQLDATGMALFAQYERRMRKLMSDVVRKASTAKAVPAFAIKRLEEQMDDARNRLTAWEDVTEAAQKLYEALSPAQREVADKRLVTSLDPKDWVGAMGGSNGPRLSP